MITVRVFDTPVKVSVKVLPFIIIIWGGVSWFGLYWHSERGFWQGLLIGFLSVSLLLIADFGHALAHIFSARRAGAPMDEILISGDMPRTIYQNNDVAPNVHRMRALGGPIFNIVGLLISITIFEISSSDSLLREFMAWSAVGHGLLILSLLPLPIVDRGTILKWTLVDRGKTERQADELVRRINWVLGTLIVIIGIGLILMRVWMIGLILLGVGGGVFVMAAGKIR